MLTKLYEIDLLFITCFITRDREWAVENSGSTFTNVLEKAQQIQKSGIRNDQISQDVYIFHGALL